jgi:hypothetical protein
MPDDKAMDMKRKAKKAQATGAILRIRSTTFPPRPVLIPLILRVEKEWLAQNGGSSP